MAATEVKANSNYHVAIRIRPPDGPSRVIHNVDTKTLAIRNPNKTQDELHSFAFSSVFDESASQEDIFNFVNDKVVGKLLDGQNGLILCYGQTGAGKSFSIFGEDEAYMPGKGSILDLVKDRKGIIPKALDIILMKSKELEKKKEVIINASVSEVYLEQIRDMSRLMNEKANINTPNLMKRLQTISGPHSFETENLEIIENSSGQIVVKNLGMVPIKNMADLYELLSSSFRLREKHDSKTAQLFMRANTERGGDGYKSSSLYFVDLAGSERIPRNFNDSKKFQESIIINSSMLTLGKCLHFVAQSIQKNYPYKESKLTRSLQNVLQPHSNIVLLAHINPNDNNFDETMATLQFADRTKNPEFFGKFVFDDDDMSALGSMPGSDKVIKKLNDEFNETKMKIEHVQKDFRQKLYDIQKLISVEIDLEKVLTKPTDRELKQLKAQRESLIELENMKAKKEESKLAIAALHKKADVCSFSLSQKIKTKEDKLLLHYNKILSEQKAITQSLQIQIEREQRISEDKKKSCNKERIDALLRLIQNSKALIEDKSQLFTNKQFALNALIKEGGETEEEKMKAYSQEKELKAEILALKEKYSKVFSTLEKDFHEMMSSKEEKLKDFIRQSVIIVQELRDESKQLSSEVVDLFCIASSQKSLIEKVENGDFTAGMKSFNIPMRDKPHFPSEKKHGLAMKLYSRKKAEFAKVPTSILQVSNIRSPAEFERSSTKEFLVKRKEESSQEEGLRQLEDEIDVKLNTGVFSETQLIRYAKSFRAKLQSHISSLAKAKERQELYQKLSSNINIEKLVGEREESKQKFWSEWKKNAESRVLLESQKRKINSQIQFGTKSAIQSKSNFNSNLNLK